MEQQLRDHATRLARVEQRVEDQSITLAAMAPLIAQHAQMDVRFGHQEEEIRALRDDVGKLRAALNDREQQDRDDREQRAEREAQDRRSRRTAYIAAAVALAVQLIATLGLIISQGGVG